MSLLHSNSISFAQIPIENIWNIYAVFWTPILTWAITSNKFLDVFLIFPIICSIFALIRSWGNWNLWVKVGYFLPNFSTSPKCIGGRRNFSMIWVEVVNLHGDLCVWCFSSCSAGADDFRQVRAKVACVESGANGFHHFLTGGGGGLLPKHPHLFQQIQCACTIISFSGRCFWNFYSSHKLRFRC